MNDIFNEIKLIKKQYRTTVDKYKVVSEFYEPCLNYQNLIKERQVFTVQVHCFIG